MNLELRMCRKSGLSIVKALKYYKKCKCTNRTLAAQFGVSESTVQKLYRKYHMTRRINHINIYKRYKITDSMCDFFIYRS